MNKKLIYLTLASLFFFSVEVKSQADEIRSYMGISAGYTLITGSFNGSEFFQTEDHIVLVPKIKPSFGMGGVIGTGSVMKNHQFTPTNVNPAQLAGKAVASFSINFSFALRNALE